MLSLVVVLAATCLMASDVNAQAWDFGGLGSKAEAIAQATNDRVLKTLSHDYLSPNQLSRLQSMFYDWAAHYNYTFSPIDASTALYNFKLNMQLVYAVNTDSSIPYWLSGNQYSSLTPETFRNTALGKNPVPASEGNTSNQQTSNRRLLREADVAGRRRMLVALPAVVDWRTAGKVTPVKDQGHCGASWAFAATAAIESAYLIAAAPMNNTLSSTVINATTLNLSEEELLQCCNSDNGCPGSAGCNGGLADEAINFVARRGQLAEAVYPYSLQAAGTDSDAATCNATLLSSVPDVQLQGQAIRVTPLSKEALMQAVATAPTMIYFSANSTFRSYAGGIYTGGDCDNTTTNHAMVAVGYNTTNGTMPNWIIRNSFGEDWGESGYIRVLMTEDGNGLCGMYLESYRPPLAFNTTDASPEHTPTPAPPCPCLESYVYNGILYTNASCAPGATSVTTGHQVCIVPSNCTNYVGLTAYSDPMYQPFRFCNSTAAQPPSTPTRTNTSLSNCTCLTSYVYNGTTYGNGTCAPGASSITQGLRVCVVSDTCNSTFGTTAYSDPPGQPFVICPETPACACLPSYSYNRTIYVNSSCAQGVNATDVDGSLCLVSPACSDIVGATELSEPPYQPYKLCSTMTSPLPSTARRRRHRVL